MNVEDIEHPLEKKAINGDNKSAGNATLLTVPFERWVNLS
ncbi:hypothetical protein SAMN02745220_02918 [Desulfopila aestuarii DSM 18488]|uniref:Uncharacterized protein n=1 Tax=Desulfopila aestuarii DSM 18488 TaxID=1121416 RepID=A0A1M7YAC5_9BACT|nr:hypothetical protein SAMN02745220_02918 [Desulfopila aestuarii DSM 18488]